MTTKITVINFGPGIVEAQVGSSPKTKIYPGCVSPEIHVYPGQDVVVKEQTEQNTLKKD